MKSKLNDVPGLISEAEHEGWMKDAAAEEAMHKKESEAPVLAQLCGALSAKHFGQRLAKRVSKWTRLPRSPIRSIDWGNTRRKLLVPSNQERDELFIKWARQNGNFMTLTDVNHAVEELWPWWMAKRETDPKTGRTRVVHEEWKPPLVRAYRAADTSRCGWIGRKEFRMLLLYAVYLNEIWSRLDEVHPPIRKQTGEITPGQEAGNLVELDDSALIDEEKFVFICCELNVMVGHHQDPLRKIEGRSLFKSLCKLYEPLAYCNKEGPAVGDSTDTTANTVKTHAKNDELCIQIMNFAFKMMTVVCYPQAKDEPADMVPMGRFERTIASNSNGNSNSNSNSNADSEGGKSIHFSEFCSWLATTHVTQREAQSQKATVGLIERIVAHCETNDTLSRDDAARLGAFTPLVKMLSAKDSTRSVELQLLATKALYLLSEDHAGRQLQIVERGALGPLTQIVMQSKDSEAALWATGVMAHVCR